jgi:acyl carrier protein
MDSLLLEVQDVFRDVLDQPHLVLTRESNAENVEDWDSLSHINLISAISKKYDVRFRLGELEELKNVGELLDLLQVKLNVNSK